MERQPMFFPIGNLPLNVKKKVAFYLDKQKPPNWRSVIAQMPPEMYTQEKVEALALHTLKPDGSPTLSLLKDLEERQVSLRKLIDWIEKSAEPGSSIFRILSLLMPHSGNCLGSPNISLQPEDQSVIYGADLILTCEATGQAPLQYQWFKEKIMLNNQRSNQLILPSVRKRHQGCYVCRVSNIFGYTFTRWANVEIEQGYLDNLNAPVFAMHPRCCSLHVGESLNLYCDAVGIPCPTFQWYHEGKPIKGEVGREYIVNNVRNEHQGKYFCEAKNSSGSLHSQTAEVTILQVEKPPLSPLFEGRGADVLRICETPSTWSNQPTGKIALVIGNQQYENGTKVGELVHPRNDARDISGILASIGFRVVSLVDLTLQEMKEAVDLFCNIVEQDMYAVFYFAGHGFEVNSESFLMPVNGSGSFSCDENFSVSRLLIALTRRRAKLNLLLLDCCRSTPRECKIDPIPQMRQVLPVQEKNTVICFACCSQARSLECPAHSNGFFATQLIKHLGKQKKVDDVLFDVARGMHTDEILDPVTGQQQIAYRLSTLVEELSLYDKPIENYKSRGIELWKEANQMPPSPTTVFENDFVKVDLSFFPEFSNVLVIHSNISTNSLSECLVHLRVPSKVGGSRVELLYSNNERKAINGNSIRITRLQCFEGELDIHIEVVFYINGREEKARNVFSLREKILYGKILKENGKYQKTI